MTFDRSLIVRTRRIALLATAAAMLAPRPSRRQRPLPSPQRAKPAAPAAPAQPAPQPSLPARARRADGPSVVQVKPEPSQSDWLKVCGKDPGLGQGDLLHDT